MRANRLIGRQVAGRFTIKSFLGEGGMATVFVAEQDQEPRQVALKIMNEDLTADRSFVKRFQREAKAAARVQHPNSVAIIDYGVAEGISYIAMELLAGEDLYALLERDGAIHQGRAARIVVEVCDALMVAHELGIVHRDLKPENIMVVADPTHPNGERVKVLDFGIAKLLAPDTVAPVAPRRAPAAGVTRAGTFIGTPAYMSPEQCALLPVDTRADIYTCGVLLFQLCTGRLPFEGQTPLHTATLHIHEPAPRPSTFAPTIDPRLESIILKALAKKPTERHQTARHLASTLRKILPDLPDVRVAKVGKPTPGSLRQSGRTRNSAVEAPRPAAGNVTSGGSDLQMESAKTMVAPHGSTDGGSPAVVRSGATSSDPDSGVDTPPARIRPAAGTPVTMGETPKPPARPGAAPPPTDDDAPDSDSDDSMRTLVRAPVDDDAPQRFGPLHTEVIEPSAASVVIAASLGVPPAPPPPVGPAMSSSAPGASRTPPRVAKATLKSAGEFKPAMEGATLDTLRRDGAPAIRMPAPRPPSSPPPSPNITEEIAVVPVVSAGGPKALGSLQLGSSQLSTSAPAASSADAADGRAGDDGAPPGRSRALPQTPGGSGDRHSAVPQPPGPVAFAETAKMELPDPASLGVRPSGAAAGPEVSGTAQTVPLISPGLIASVLTKGPAPRQVATTMPVVIPPSGIVSPASKLNLPPEGPVATLLDVAIPSAASLSVDGRAPSVLPVPPQTPPVYPLAPVDEGGDRISGARGLLIGFLAGALLMGLIAVVYLALGR